MSCPSTRRVRSTGGGLEGCGTRSTNRCRCGGCLRRDAEVVEQGLHVEAERFVVAVDGGPVLGWAASSWRSDPGDEGCDDVVAEGEQRGDGPRGTLGNVVAAGSAGL